MMLHGEKTPFGGVGVMPCKCLRKHRPLSSKSTADRSNRIQKRDSQGKGEKRESRHETRFLYKNVINFELASFALRQPRA